MTIFFVATLCLAVGLAIGIGGALIYIANEDSHLIYIANEDSHLIDHMDEYRLTLSNHEGRWAVFQTIDGKQVMIGQSHETARGALVAARSAACG